MLDTVGRANIYTREQSDDGCEKVSTVCDHICDANTTAIYKYIFLFLKNIISFANGCM